MFRVLLATLELMDHVIILFSLITTQNMFGFIRWLLNLVFLYFFPHYKKFVENRFQKSIKALYSDNGGVFIALNFFFLSSWHHSPHHRSLYIITKRCIWTSSCRNRPHLPSRCKPRSLLFSLCFSNCFLPHQQTTHSSPLWKITIRSSFWS